MTGNITMEKTSPTHSYDEIVMPTVMIIISYAFNDSYIFGNSSEGIIRHS